MASSFQIRILELLEVADRATTHQEKGRAFEDLVCHLFLEIPGLVNPQRNTKNAFGTEEIGLAFWNERDPAGLIAFEPILLIECKNWSSPVSSIEVNWFLTKIENRGLSFGILVAANGITGDAEDRKLAHDLVSKALAKRLRLVVITRPEIEQFESGADLVRLIKEKLCQLVVSGTVWP